MPEWLNDFLGDLTVAQVAIWCIAVFLLARTLYKGWPWIRKLVKLIDSLGQLPAFMDRTNTKIDEIHHEVHYNNGTSVKDAVRRVETGVAGLYTKVDELHDADAAMEQKLEDTQSRSRFQPPKD